MKIFAIGIFAAGLICSGALAQGADPGKTLWEGPNTQCRNCHGKAGEGGLGPALAGRSLSPADFRQAARKPWGIMPAFTPEQVSDAELADFAAYFAGLARPGAPGPWRVPLPENGLQGQRVAISLGCAQCHGATFDIARGILGGRDVGFDQFRALVYNHTLNMSKLGIAEGNTPGERLHMGNYDPLRVSQDQLRAIYDWTRNDLGFRPALEARLTESEGQTYLLKIHNDGVPDKGLTAQDLTVDIVLPAGVTLVRATGDGFKGTHSDPEAKADIVEWRLARMAPTEAREFAVTLSAPVQGPMLKGSVRWTAPAPKTGAKFDRLNFALRPAG